MKMKKESNERKRASNIIWTASGDYSFESEIKSYDDNGKADLYLNYIIGAVHKYYASSHLQNFFDDLAGDGDRELLENLMWIGLENCTFEKTKSERPVLERLRQNYAKKVLSQYNSLSANYILSEISIVHFQRALGKEPKMSRLAFDMLRDLEFDKSMNTEQIITRMNKIISVYFGLPAHSGKKRKQHYYTIHRIPFLRLFSIVPTQHSGKINIKKAEPKKKHEPKQFISHWFRFLELSGKHTEEDIQTLYGTAILPKAQTKVLEQVLCNGTHKNCHLYFRRGELKAVNANKNAVYHRNLALQQREKNKDHYHKNLARNNNNIAKLTNEIRNAILINLESSSSKSKNGKLVAGKVWRNIYLHDNKIFIKNLENGVADLSVDIMLDASSSQINRQEMIATEGYIIAESLTRCQIPVRVYSFRSQKNYTIINFFRDYNEINKNDKIFNYYAAGCNRDGLAIRTALYMMKDSPYEHKMLIVLSDGVPNDTEGIPADKFTHAKYDYYIGTPSIKDTALEIRKGRQRGISVLCIFTGLDQDFPAIKKIYGHNLAYIKSQDRFANTVGILVRNELKSL